MVSNGVVQQPRFILLFLLSTERTGLRQIDQAHQQGFQSALTSLWHISGQAVKWPDYSSLELSFYHPSWTTFCRSVEPACHFH